VDSNLPPWGTSRMAGSCRHGNEHAYKLDIHVSVHHNIIYKNEQQDATLQDNLLFLGCSTRFGRYFLS
jgi:hypothetical protein